ncbi:septum formation initiator family protein [bacterium]|nr:septum formation initiator family protein [bacterium]
MKKGGRWLVVIAVVAVVSILFLAGPNGLVRLIQLKSKESELEKRITHLEAEIELTRQKVQKLHSDPDFLREMAKEKLQMLDPRDTVKKDTPKDSASSTGQASDSSSKGST